MTRLLVCQQVADQLDRVLLSYGVVLAAAELENLRDDVSADLRWASERDLSESLERQMDRGRSSNWIKQETLLEALTE